MNPFPKWTAGALLGAAILVAALWGRPSEEVDSSAPLPQLPKAEAAPAEAPDSPGVDTRAEETVARLQREFVPTHEGGWVHQAAGAAATLRPDGRLTFARPEAEVKFELRTGRVAIGDRPLLRQAETVAADGAVELRYGKVVERFEAVPEGVEQTWHFAESPGSGDLEVEVEVAEGLRPLASEGGGLRFASADGTIYRYGAATWIDADGKKAAVPQHFADGAIRMRVPAALVGKSRFPAVLDPVISAEHRIADTPAHPPRQPAHQVAMATAGDVHLVAWIEGTELFAIRLGDDGMALDTEPFMLSSAASNAPLDVGSSADSFFVVWQQGNNLYGQEHFAGGSGVAATYIVANSGLNSRPRVDATQVGSSPAWAIVWERKATSNSNGEVWGRTLHRGSSSGSGTTSARSLRTWFFSIDQPDVACHPSNGDCVLAYREALFGGDHVLEAVRWTPASDNFGSEVSLAASANNPHTPRIDYAGGKVAAAWLADLNTVRFARIYFSFTPGVINVYAETDYLNYDGDGDLSLVGLSDGMAVAWDTSEVVFFPSYKFSLSTIRWTVSGLETETIQHSTGSAFSGSLQSHYVSVSATDDDTISVATNRHKEFAFEFDFSTVRMDQFKLDLTLRHPYDVAVALPFFHQRDVHAAYSTYRNRIGVTWVDRRTGVDRVWATFLAPDGSVIVSPFAVGPPYGYFGAQREPYIVEDVNNFSVVWRQRRGGYIGDCDAIFARVYAGYGSTPTELATSALQLSPCMTTSLGEPVAAAENGTFYYAWPQGSSPSHIYGNRATKSGTTYSAGPSQLLGGYANDERNLTAAYIVGETYFAWEGTAAGIPAVFVISRSGNTVTQQFGIANAASPALGDGLTLIAYKSTLGTPVVKVAQFNQPGVTVSQPGDSVIGKISLAPVGEIPINTALVSWQGRRGLAKDLQILGAWFQTSSLQVTEALEISHALNGATTPRAVGVDERAPTTISIEDEVAVFYTYPDLFNASERIVFRYLGKGPDGHDCSHDDECISDHCGTTGFCCEEECACGSCDETGACVTPELSCWPGEDHDCNGLTSEYEIQLCEGELCDEESGDTWVYDPAVGHLVCGCPGGDTELSCDDRRDNDCDGLFDCNDPDCFEDFVCVCPEGPSPETTSFACSDGQDNDCDLQYDCADADCDGVSCKPGNYECSFEAQACVCVPTNSGPEDSCWDGLDNDCDGRIDCEDPDCEGLECVNGICESFTCIEICEPEICDDEIDNDCDDRVDCADPDCEEQCTCGDEHPSVRNCDDGRDNDCDDLIDCKDPDCKEDEACQCDPVAEEEDNDELCSNGKDDDCDGLVDCEEETCQGVRCGPEEHFICEDFSCVEH